MTESTGPADGKVLYDDFRAKHPTPGDGSVWVSWEGLRPELALLWSALAAFARDDDPIVPKWYADHIGGKLEGIEAKLDFIGDALSKDYNERFGPKAE